MRFVSLAKLVRTVRVYSSEYFQECLLTGSSKLFLVDVAEDLARLICRAGTTPILEKKAPRMLGKMKIFHVGSHQFQELLRELWFFVLLKSWDVIPRMEFRIPTMEFRIPRVAQRIPRNSPRALRMAFSLRECFA